MKEEEAASSSDLVKNKCIEPGGPIEEVKDETFEEWEESFRSKEGRVFDFRQERRMLSLFLNWTF